MLSLVLMLAVGQLDGGTPDAGEPPLVVLDVVHGDLLIREESDGVVATVPRQVGDGCYIPTESCIRLGKQKARTEGRLEESNAQSVKWLAVAFGSGAVVGVVTIVALGLVTGVVRR